VPGIRAFLQHVAPHWQMRGVAHFRIVCTFGVSSVKAPENGRISAAPHQSVVNC
jgi:hypothetical protein